jgi:hypothetical protein
MHVLHAGSHADTCGPLSVARCCQRRDLVLLAQGCKIVNTIIARSARAGVIYNAGQTTGWIVMYVHGRSCCCSVTCVGAGSCQASSSVARCQQAGPA